MASTIYTAPPNSGTSILGKTLPSLLYDAALDYDNDRALNQPHEGGWRTTSTEAFREQAEETAFGLLALGLARGDRVALFMESDVHFCVADMGCLLAGMVDVPIYLTHAPDQIHYVIEHSEATVVFATDTAGAHVLAPLLPRLPSVHTVVVAEPGGDRPALPRSVQWLSFEELRARGRAEQLRDGVGAGDLLSRIHPEDLATIIYTSGTTGAPKGVMLTHENISHNALTAFSGLQDYVPGPGGEVAISFLPLTHIFARTLHYGFLSHGSSVYFTPPDDLRDVLAEVRPTVFATVPRVLEKVYGGIQKKADELSGVKRRLLAWSLRLARRYELGHRPTGLYALQLALADRLVFAKWRDALGGRVKYLICGGAALDREIANVFCAAGVQVLQGYGLTETSPVITFNRPDRNRAGTVGVPMPGVEVTLADDGEILTRGPLVMKGYYKDPERTRDVIDDEGWLHTGDIGDFTAEGYLRITDRKKDLFKLSTGKYVTPQPLETRLATEPLVGNALVVGSGYKFCMALVFPDEDALRAYARSVGIDAKQSLERLVKEPRVLARYQELVDRANAGMDKWSTIKRFRLVPKELTTDNTLLTPTLKVRRSKVRERYQDIIQEMYDEAETERPRGDLATA